MAYTEVQSLDCDTAVSLGGINKKTGKKNPTSVEGYYLGSREFDSPKSKTGKAWMHVFQTKNGTVGVYGKTDLDRKISQATRGAMTRVTQNGMQQTKNGEMYKFKVEIDLDNAIEVAENFGGAAASNEDTTEDSDTSYSASSEVDEQEEEDIDEPLDEVEPVRAAPPKQAAPAPDAARRAKVQALLSKGRNKTA